MQTHNNPLLLPVLELTPPPTAQQIKTAYKSLTLKYHSNENPDRAEKFIEITAAYEALLPLPNPEAKKGRCECFACLLHIVEKYVRLLPKDLSCFSMVR